MYTLSKSISLSHSLKHPPQSHTPHTHTHRLHYALQGYHELLKFIHEMSTSKDENLRDNSKVMLSNLVYHQEYRDVFVSLLRNYNEVVQVLKIDAVEPLNKGHVGTGSFVFYRKVSFIWSVLHQRFHQ